MERVERLAAGEDLDIYVELEKIDTGPKLGDTWTDPVTGMEFVWVEGGCCMMGSNDGDSDEKPVHEVCVDGFWMGEYEVTQGQWEEIMGNNPSYFDKGDNYPVERVSWNDCQEFIEKLNRKSNGNFRLPTEAEWEYAARSRGKRIKYPWGNSLGSGNANCDGCGSRWDDERTVPVGSFDPNDLGLYDMAGNVWEWCADWYNSDAYSQHSRNNPIYDSGGSNRVKRGGSWNNNPSNVRCANRNNNDPGNMNNNIGFRLLNTGTSSTWGYGCIRIRYGGLDCPVPCPGTVSCTRNLIWVK